MFTSRELRQMSKIVRSDCNQSGSPHPIKVVDGFAKPKLIGRSYGWRSVTGIWWRGSSCPKWSKTYRYVHSTQKIEVGAGWILENLLK